MQGFLTEERGNIRLGLTIAAAILVILAVVAVPMLAGQARSAQDVRARSAVSDLAKQVEACRIDAGSYRACDEPRELKAQRKARWGQGSGDAGVLTEQSTETAFTAYSVSGSGARIYVWSSRDSQPTKHACTHGSVERLARDDCDGPPW